MMKKLLAILLAAFMLLSMVACDLGNTEDPNKDNPGTSQNDDKGGENNNNNNNNNNPASALNRADMEKKIADILKGVGGPSTISFFDGSEFEYTEGGFLFAGDTWTVSGVTMSWSEIEAHLDSQLLSIGFKKASGFIDQKWYIDAGSEKMGFSIMFSDGEATITMTHATADYTQAYIDAAMAKMPDVIAGRTALDKLPENFKISYKAYDDEYTAIRLNGNWFFKTLNLDPDDYFYNTYSSDAYILQSDGSYKLYSYSSIRTNPRWEDDGLVTLEKLDEKIESFFDADGGRVSISTYLQICLEKQEGEDAFDLFEQPSRDYNFSSTLIKTGTATVAGISCVVATTDDLFQNFEYSYDPTTGILFKLRSFGNNYPEEIEMEITEYDLNPTSLGDFVQP